MDLLSREVSRHEAQNMLGEVIPSGQDREVLFLMNAVKDPAVDRKERLEVSERRSRERE